MKTRSLVFRLSILCTGLLSLVTTTTFAQDSATAAKKPVPFFHLSDTNQLTKNDFLMSVDRAYQTLNRVQNDAELNRGLTMMKQEADKNKEILAVLKTILNGNSRTNLRNLQLYKRMLTDFKDDNENTRKVLATNITKLEQAKHDVYAIANDTVLQQLIANSLRDTTRRSRLKPLQLKWAQTDSLVSAGMDTLNNWGAAFAIKSINIAELLNTIDDKIRQNGIQELKGDYNYLWEPDTMRHNITARSEFRKNSRDIQQILNYYMHINSGSTFWLPLFLVLFLYWWVKKNYKTVLTAPNAEVLLGNRFVYLGRRKFLPLLILVLSLIPFFDIYAPWSYFVLIQLIIVVSVAIVLPYSLRRVMLLPWICLIALLLGIAFLDGFHFNIIQRCALIGINILSIAAGILLLRRVKFFLQLKRFIRIVCVLFIGLNVLAIICNLYGRVSVAQGFSNAAIMALTQIIALSVFKQVAQEILLLQLVKSRVKRAVLTPFDYEPIIRNLQKPLSFVIIFLWVICLMANLNMYAMLRTIVSAIFTSPINIGSANFTLGSIVLFLFIVWLAHLLQRYVSYFFGDTGNEEEINKSGRSNLLITRLVVLCAGYLLAVAASGLPIDKITIVLGALGVGIGMGLQNIVNNFVSGIILAFDRPLQIGDSVVIGNNAGRVKEIGIRSSTLLTADGAEVIIPNGDILSQSITNWTLSNEQRRIELEFTIETNESRDAVIALLTESVLEAEHVLEQPKPVVLVENVKENELQLKISFWCANVTKADWVKSEVRYLLYGKLREHGMVVK